MQTEMKHTSREVMRKIADELQVAQKSFDLEKLLSIYHPECLIEYPGLGIKHRGHSSVRAGMALFKSIFRNYENVNQEWAYDTNTLASWGSIEMTLTGNFSGHIPNGRRITLLNFRLIKFLDDMIIYEGHYLDRAALCLQSGIPVEALMRGKNEV